MLQPYWDFGAYRKLPGQSTEPERDAWPADALKTDHGVLFTLYGVQQQLFDQCHANPSSKVLFRGLVKERLR